jgi:hypothetical protein
MNINKPILKATLFVLFIFVISSSVFPATYYVDATHGRDSNNSTSEATAWKTIAKVTASRFNPGDQILFKRGDIRSKQLQVGSSGAEGRPITFGSYGMGNSPTITGANPITGWSLYYGTTFKAATISIPPKQVFMDSARLTIWNRTEMLTDKG